MPDEVQTPDAAPVVDPHAEAAALADHLIRYQVQHGKAAGSWWHGAISVESGDIPVCVVVGHGDLADALRAVATGEARAVEVPKLLKLLGY